MTELYLGYDPGGGGAHGVAATNGRQAFCDTVATAQEAIDWFHAFLQGRKPTALGIDTLTLWSTGPAGWRPADRALQAAYPAVHSSIVAPNSLYGAMPINGVAVAFALCTAYKELRITETHPKVLYFELTGKTYDFVQARDQMIDILFQQARLDVCDVASEHAWDALVSAFAAREWNIGKWKNDLHQLPQGDRETLVPAHGFRAHYAWPKVLPSTLLPPDVERAAHPPKGGRSSTPRRRDRWKVAVERLEQAGHADVAQQIAEYRNARNERAGWDSWLKSNFPAIWTLVEERE